MNPADAERIGIKNGQEVELEGLDTGVKGRTTVKITNRVMPGVLFAHGFSGGVRTKQNLGAYEYFDTNVSCKWIAKRTRQLVVSI